MKEMIIPVVTVVIAMEIITNSSYLNLHKSRINTSKS